MDSNGMPFFASKSCCSGFSTCIFSMLSCAIRFIATIEIASVIWGARMSAKWRRSRRFLKWIDPAKPVNLARNSKILNVQKFKPSFGVHPKRYRIPRSFGKDSLKEPQPLIDIFQEESWVTIVAEIAGFNKETLKIDVKDQKLKLSAKAKERRYYKSLNLPNVVIPNVIHTMYKNGVLEIKLKRALPEQTIKKQVG